MDPSRYARAFGVQSESNKATVTRVASNEIVFRRAVDTYRRDMTSKMTSLHREQKKLKRNMRTYRRKLREAQNLPVKRRKPFKIGWIAYDSQTSFYDMATIKDKHKKANKFPSEKLQSQVDVFLKSVDDHIHNMSLKKHVPTEPEGDNEILYDKSGRRRFLFGSGGIGISSDALKGLELELEGYNFHDEDYFSDNSSEGGGGHAGERKLTQKQSRRQRVLELLRLNSAYFTPIDLKDHDTDQSINEANLDNSTNENKDEGKTNPDGDANQTSQPVNSDQTGIVLPVISHNNKPEGGKPVTFSNAISSVVRAVKERNEMDAILAQNRNPSHSVEHRRSNQVNYGDLIKFKHGMNTRKLFSMVDQLASKHNLSSKDDDSRREIRRPQQNHTNSSTNQNLERINDFDSKTPVLPAMKRNYRQGLSPSQKDDHRNGPSPTGSHRNGEHQMNPQTSGDRLHGDSRRFLNIDNFVEHPYDMTDGPSISSERVERNHELPFLQVSSPASLTRQNLDGKETNRTGNDALTSFRGNEDAAKNRRGSILDASNYVSNLRRRTMIQEHDRMFGIKNDADRFGPRRMPAALRKSTISEHQRKADDNKIPWSSALGQMKLIHTLQDLTHFI